MVLLVDTVYLNIMKLIEQIYLKDFHMYNLMRLLEEVLIIYYIIIIKIELCNMLLLEIYLK